MEERNQNIIKMKPIGIVSRTSSVENERDRSLITKIVIEEDLAPALAGIDEWSHIFVIFWLDRVVHAVEPKLYHRNSGVGNLCREVSYSSQSNRTDVSGTC